MTTDQSKVPNGGNRAADRVDSGPKPAAVDVRTRAIEPGAAHSSATEASVYDESSWRVEDIPNWGMQWLQEVQQDELTAERFFREFAGKWQPVVIRGACKRWPVRQMGG